MQHNPDRRYGENIFSCKGYEPTGQQAVTNWYLERDDYSYHKAQFQPKTGHFTALVWCKSERVGIGRAHSRSGTVFVVANYDPPGNVAGEFGANVLRNRH